MPILSSLALSALLLLSGPASANLVPGAVHGTATASDYLFKSDDTSFYFEQTTHRHHFVCSDCFLRINVTVSGLTIATPAGPKALGPGVYEFREFAGSIAFTRETFHRFSFQIEGVADIKGPL